MTVSIEGTSPLIFHRWSEKSKKMILDKQQKKAKIGREVRDLEKEYQDSYYKNSSGDISIPAISLKQAIVGSARFLDDIPMTLIRGAIFVRGDEDGLIPIEYKEEKMRTDMVRVGRGSADIRARGQVSNWSAEICIEFNEAVFSRQQVLNLVQIAGFSQGILEWRPEKDGIFGTFAIATGKKVEYFTREAPVI